MKNKKFFSLLLTASLFLSCCVPAFADTSADAQNSQTEVTDDGVPFGQDDILKITYKETEGGDDVTLYDKQSEDPAVNSLMSLQMPAETAGITVQFSVEKVQGTQTKVWIVSKEDFESKETWAFTIDNGTPYTEQTCTLDESKPDKVTLDGTYLDYGKEYVILVQALYIGNAKYFGIEEGGNSNNFAELFRFKTETPEETAAGYDEAHPVEIRNAEDLCSIWDDPHGGKKYYKLMNDIDMSGVNDYSVNTDMVFSGVLDGDGYAIKNFTYTTDSYGSAGFCNLIKNDVRDICCVKDLTFLDVKFGTKDQPVGNSGIFAISGFGHFKFSNVHIGTTSETARNEIFLNMEGASVNQTKFGSLVGSISSMRGVTIENCTVEHMTIQSDNNNWNNNRVGAFVGQCPVNTAMNYDPENLPVCKMTDCSVSDLEIEMNGSGYAGAFMGSIGNADVSNCKAEDVTIELASAQYLVGGMFGQLSLNSNENISNKVSNVEICGVDIILKGAISGTTVGIGGFAGDCAGGELSNINMSDVSIYGDEDIVLSVNNIPIGGLAGKLTGNNKIGTVKNVAISGLDIENIDLSGNQYIAGLAAYITQGQTSISDVYVDCDFINCSSATTNRFGEIMSYLGSGKTLTIRNTYYNAENRNDTKESLNGLFDIASLVSDTVTITSSIPVTFDIEVVADEDEAAAAEDESAGDDATDAEGGDTAEPDTPQTPQTEPMTNRDSATVSVQAYAAVVNEEDGTIEVDEDGNIVKGDKIEGFFEKFPDAVSVEWDIVPYPEPVEGAEATGSDEGFTANNTRVTADAASPFMATVSSSASVGTEEDPAKIVVSAKINGVERTVVVPYRYVRVSSGGGGSAQTTVQKPEITVAGGTEGGSVTLSSDGTKATITPAEGYVISDVTLNGESVGAVSQLSGLKTGDEVVVTFAEEDVLPPDNTPAETEFSDVADSAWYKEAVDFVVSEGLFNGTGDKTFSPQSDMTRAMFVTVLSRLSGAQTGGTGNPFADVPAGTWYTDSVSWAAANGIVNGVSETSFAPNASITREQMTAMLYNYAKWAELDIADAGGDAIASMPDASEISSYAETAMAWAYNAGLIKGTDGGRLEPKSLSTRAEVATIFERFVKWAETQEASGSGEAA